MLTRDFLMDQIGTRAFPEDKQSHYNPIQAVFKNACIKLLYVYGSRPTQEELRWVEQYTKDQQAAYLNLKGALAPHIKNPIAQEAALLTATEFINVPPSQRGKTNISLEFTKKLNALK